ncbi:MAG TPA: TIGR03809 family protein [Xanthobacteraceae bacterium]|nr:TIGR03809 family protein [Xanthobacteraceae bacterium]
MSERREPRSAHELARQWQSLAERRRAHLLELHRSGRWRRYYTEEQLTAQMREAVRSIEEWGAHTGQPVQPVPEVAPLREAAE